MKQGLTIFAATALLSISSLAFAGTKSTCVFQGNIVGTDQIAKTTQDLGFTPLQKHTGKTIELKDECVYRMKATDQSGKEWKLFFDPNTGNLIGKRRDLD